MFKKEVITFKKINLEGLAIYYKNDIADIIQKGLIAIFDDSDISIDVNKKSFTIKNIDIEISKNELIYQINKILVKSDYRNYFNLSYYEEIYKDIEYSINTPTVQVQDMINLYKKESEKYNANHIFLDVLNNLNLSI